MSEPLSTDDMLTLLEHEQQRQHERIRAMLIAEGRQDVADWLDAKLREVRLGVEAARGIWHALSVPQRDCLIGCADGGRPMVSSRTAEALIKRRLIEWRDGPVLTEHGRFVLKHGQSKGAPLP